MKQEILVLLKNLNPKLCVMATCGIDNQPECAVLTYVVHDDLTITISTHSKSRKWKNLEGNKKVALTFGWDFGKPYIQYEGIAELFTQGVDHQWHEEIYFKEHPDLIKFKGPDTVFLKVTPTWVRLTDYSSHPPRVEEEVMKLP